MKNLSRAVVLTLVGAFAALTLAVTPARAATDASYDRSDSGTTAKVRKGDTFKIDLVVAAGTGCDWRMTSGRRTPHFKVLSRAEVEETSDPMTVGFPVHVVYTVKATRRGAGKFRAVLECPSGKPSRFNLRIKVLRPALS